MEHISGSLEELFKKLELDTKIRGWSALQVWEEVVGPRIAANTKPSAFRDGRLFVQVATTTWKHELSFLRHEIIRKLNAKLGTRVIEDIVFSLGH
ncbi:MAG: DUF721 domain-containing protein [Candidatus Eisenbacteria bacterium]